MDRLTFQTSMARMIAAFSAEVSPEKAEVYWEELRHLPDAVFVVATKQALSEWEKPYALPPIAILKRYASHAQGALGVGQPTALDAWGEFRRKVTLRLNLDLLAHGPEDEARRVGLTPTELRIARRLGGLAHLAQMPAKDLDWKAKEFAAVYDEVAQRQEAEDALVALEPGRVPLLAEGE